MDTGDTVDTVDTVDTRQCMGRKQLSLGDDRPGQRSVTSRLSSGMEAGQPPPESEQVLKILISEFLLFS